jgi:2-polyprenyl-3-methyl-5-hydroxy-6-metoxy-1,4-benzoquinol methylase
MKELFSLGEIYISDFLAEGEEGVKHELKMVMDESIGAARLETTAPLSRMFGKYWYRSGTNQSMKVALKDVVDSILPIIHHSFGDSWLDIACNDGTLLSLVPATFMKVGVDPCEGNIYNEARKHGEIIQSYFSKRLFGVDGAKFKVITTIAMFYDLEDPETFCKDVYEVMADDGLWVIQQSYTPLMIQQLAFDNILSEHVYYHTLASMKILLERTGFEIVDCTLNDVNGGSFRLFVKKKGQPFATPAYRDVCKFRIESTLKAERDITWDGFYDKVLDLKRTVLHFIQQAKFHGKTVMGYGASTKGNTLLQFFGLDDKLITAIAERQPQKYGLKTVGTNIPIISEEEMRAAQPDYLLVLPWQFEMEFIEREKEYLKNGGKMIFPLPQFHIV